MIKAVQAAVSGSSEQVGVQMITTKQGLRDWIYSPGKRHLLRSLVLVYVEIVLGLAHVRACFQARRYRGRSDLRFHLGGGHNRRDGWVNVDLGPHADLRLDLRRALPFASRSATVVCSEHFLEHLAYPGTVHLHLCECFRVLGSGGVIHVGVPHGEMYVRRYLDELSRGRSQIDPPRFYPGWARTPMERLNFIFHQAYIEDRGQHRFAYDFETLARRLADAGFVDVAEREWDETLDSQVRRHGTLRVQARKP